MLEKAKSAVQNINPAQLNEVRTYKMPPGKVKMTLEAVLFIIKGKKYAWDDIKQEMSRPDFLPSILNFQTSTLTEKQKQSVKNEFLNSADWDVTAIDRSSKAAGPMAIWLESQVKYSDMLLQVKPLNDKIAEMAQNKQRLEEQ